MENRLYPNIFYKSDLVCIIIEFAFAIFIFGKEMDYDNRIVGNNQ